MSICVTLWADKLGNNEEQDVPHASLPLPIYRDASAPATRTTKMSTMPRAARKRSVATPKWQWRILVGHP